MPKKILVMYSNEAASSGHLERLGALASDWEVVAARNAKMAVEHAPDVQIILGHRYLRQVLRHSSKIKWVQSTAAGIEHLIDDRLLKFAPMLSRCPIFSETIALHALTLAMAVTRRIPAAVLAQAERRWLSQSEILPIDQPHTAMVIGMGGIGQELGKRLKAQTIHVIGVTKNTTPPTDCFDELIFASAWKNRLPEVDWCFLAIPESPDNHRFFDQVAIESLHARAVLVNVGRASTLDQQALL
ncbi:MAG: NAD(P)-dependent oxidoreductase, partial [Cyanobacteria bacterium P01_F01_bin.3]